MTRKKTRHPKTLAMSAALCALLAGTAHSAFIGSGTDPAASTLPDTREFAASVPREAMALEAGVQLSVALAKGMWNRACALATDTLARQNPDREALGVFALCAAILDRKEALAASLRRLRESEFPPQYYAPLAEGIVHLRRGALDDAEAILKRVLLSHAGDPLVTYFTGELLHARQKDAQALAAFQAVLAKWPDYAPAMAAEAQLIATPSASKEQLNAAIKMSERAAAIEPMNTVYWRQLAELCRRAGQFDRANAIALQWLTPPALK